jgi:hypothetical protein
MSKCNPSRNHYANGSGIIGKPRFILPKLREPKSSTSTVAASSLVLPPNQTSNAQHKYKAMPPTRPCIEPLRKTSTRNKCRPVMMELSLTDRTEVSNEWRYPVQKRAVSAKAKRGDFMVRMEFSSLAQSLRS